MVFESEQALMSSLGLPPLELHVADNGPRLRLLSALFDRLDDEARNKHSDDATFLRNVDQLTGTQPAWQKTCIVDERVCKFKICHYAAEVEYDAKGFSLKNNDTLHSDLLAVMDASVHITALIGGSHTSKSCA